MTDRMYDSAEQFAQALDTLVDQAQDHASEIIRKALIDTSQNIVDDTPVDTGRLRAGWSLSADNPEDVLPGEGEHPSFQGEQPSKENVSNVPHANSWEWWLVNNLEYASVIEDGNHSDQAPQGMVAVNLQAFADHVNKYAKQDDYWEPT